MTTRTVALESFRDRPGYEKQKFSSACAVCPFCGKINDMTQVRKTACYHFVRKTVEAGQALFASPSAQAKDDASQAKDNASEVQP